MLQVHINRIGIIAPGIKDWEQCQSIFEGQSQYQKEDVGKFTPNLLRPNERRRTTNLIKLSMQVGEQILNNCPSPTNGLCAVFASSEGDTEIVDKICTALTLTDQPVSPTQFHNSVHNAPAGYWAIATECRESSTSLTSGAGTFASGLLEAATTAVAENKPVLLISYDYPPPETLQPFISIREPLACALLITHDDSLPRLGTISMETTEEMKISTLDNPDLEYLRTANSSGHSLPLLQAISEQNKGSVYIPYVAGTSLKVSVL